MKTLQLICAVFALCLLTPVCDAQEAAPPLKLEQAIELALANYPSLRLARAQKLAAEANIELARTSLLPRADLLAQENRATRNNVFGLLLPQSTLPSISGPDLGARTLESTWGSAAGLLVTWEPFDFGLRKAQIDLAKAQTKQAEANENVTKLDVTFAAAEAFLAALAQEQAVRAAQANVDRLETFGKAVYALVNNQLRPGVEASRADAELVTAKNQLIQLQQNAALARIALSAAIGQPGVTFRLDPGPLLEYTPNAPAPEPLNTFASHPLLLAQIAALDVVKARQTTLGEISDLALFRVRPLFSTLPGVSAPPPFGGNQRTVLVRVDPDKLRAFNMSPEEVVKAIAAGNAILPSGQLRTGELARIAAVNGVVRDIQELADCRFAQAQGRMFMWAT